MARLKFNALNQVECPTLILQNKAFENLGVTTNFNNFNYKDNMDAPNEISFTVNKKSSEMITPMWNNIVDFKTLYLPELEDKFEIYVSETESNGTITKQVTGTALSEAELSQIPLRDIEINTEIDYENDLYDVNFPSIFYRDYTNIDYVNSFEEIWNKDTEKYTVYDEDGETDEDATLLFRQNILRRASVVHRLLEKAINYKIVHVDETLKNLQTWKSFSIQNQDLYSVLTGSISQEYGVLFKFNSMDRTISIYDLYNTCKKCGYRGDFQGACPNIIKNEDTGIYEVCGSTDFYGQYGEDTTILVAGENLASQLTKEGNPSAVKTCFKVEGGDDIISAAVANINPSGNGYIYNIPSYMYSDMPKELVDIIKEYNKQYIYYSHEHEFDIGDENVEIYNKTIDDLYDVHKWVDKNATEVEGEKINTFQHISNPLIGYSSTTELMYNIMDIEAILQTTLMPVEEIDNLTMEETIVLLEEELPKSNVAVTSKTVLESIVDGKNTTVNKSVESMVEAVINTSLWKSEIKDYIYYKDEDDAYHWKGKVTLTEIATASNQKAKELTTEYIDLIVGIDVGKYLESKFEKTKAKYDVTKLMDIIRVPTKANNEFAMSTEDFKERLKLYSADCLDEIKKAFEACVSALVTSGLGLRDVEKPFDDEVVQGYVDKYETEKENGNISSLYDYYYVIYHERMQLAEEELLVRNEEIAKLHNIYTIDPDTVIATGGLAEARTKVNNVLNFQTFVSSYSTEDIDYWKIFCCYLREDTYTNQYYIEEGLNSTQIIDRANELISVARRELEKASYNQYTINTTLNNLLNIPEFKPIIDRFETGNWIHVKIDDEIYRLRLLSYQVNFDTIQNIDVQFSTVVFSPTYSSDIASVLQTATSIAGSYNGVVKQVEDTTKSTNVLNKLISNGVNVSDTPIKSSVTEEVVIDENGILGRAYDDITGEYEPYQWKFMRNGLHLTKDNWDSTYACMGKFDYEDPETGEMKTTYGVKADSIVGRFIMGETLSMRNQDESMTFDENGLDVTNGNVHVSINPNADNVFTIYKDIATRENNEIFYVDQNGDGYLKGKFTANDLTVNNGSFTGRVEGNSGHIGGWNIEEEYIEYDTGAKRIILDGDGVIGYERKEIDDEWVSTDDGLVLMRDGWLVRDTYYNTDGLHIESSYYDKDGKFVTTNYVQVEADDSWFKFINSEESQSHCYTVTNSTLNAMEFKYDTQGNHGIYDTDKEYWLINSTSSDWTYVRGDRILFNIITGSTVQFAHNTTSGNLFIPTHNSVYLGGTNNRWITVYSINSLNTSDLKEKEVLDHDWNVDDFIRGLKPIAYHYVGEGGTGKRVHMGFGAQDVEKLCKELNIGDLALYEAAYKDESKGEYHGENVPDEELIWGLKYNEFIAPLVLETQHLMDRCDELENRNKELESRLKRIEEMLLIQGGE